MTTGHSYAILGHMSKTIRISKDSHALAAKIAKVEDRTIKVVIERAIHEYYDRAYVASAEKAATELRKAVMAKVDNYWHLKNAEDLKKTYGLIGKKERTLKHTLELETIESHLPAGDSGYDPYEDTRWFIPIVD